MVDAVPGAPRGGPVAAGYRAEEAEEEAARFLAERPYLPSERAGETSRPPAGAGLMRLLFVCPDMRTAAPSATGRR